MHCLVFTYMIFAVYENNVEARKKHLIALRLGPRTSTQQYKLVTLIYIPLKIR